MTYILLGVMIYILENQYEALYANNPVKKRKYILKII